MLLRFEIHSVKRTKRDYKYFDVFLSGNSSKEKTGIEYIVEITAADGERYFMFHQPKSDSSLRPYKIMYVDAAKMEPRDGTKYNSPHEGAYKIRRTYSKEDFTKEVAAQKDSLANRQKKDAAEFERLAAVL